jgi:hypothetical protein
LKYTKTGNMENIQFEQLAKDLDELYDQQARKLYSHIVGIGIEAFTRDGILYKYKDTGLIEKLVSYFESTEEYEKCRDLFRVSLLVKGIPD